MDKQKHDIGQSLSGVDMSLKRWRHVPTTIISDMRQRTGVLDPAIRLLTRQEGPVAMVGRAVTASCQAPDFGAVVHAVDKAGPGDVLVIAAGGDGDTAMIGDVLCSYLEQKEAAGVVVDGMVRDIGDLRQKTQLPVWARGITPNGPMSKEGGQVNVAVDVAGVTIHPGDLIVGDDDGVAVLRPAEEMLLIDEMEAALARETEWRQRLSAGESLASVLGIESR